MKNKILMASMILASLVLAGCTLPPLDPISSSSEQNSSENSSGGQSQSSSEESQSSSSSSEQPHEHTFSSDWSYNEEQHWHASTCGHDAKDSLGNHRFENISATDEGYIDECTVCGYQRTREHNYSTTWSHDGVYHWHACTDNGFTHLKKDYGAHIMTLDYADEEGYHEHCETCGYAVINPHNYATAWSTNATHHWHACTDEGFTDLRIDYGEHTFNDDDHGGSVTHYCTVCQYSKDEIYADSPISSSRTMTTKYYDYRNELSSIDSTIYFMNSTGDVPYVEFNGFYNSHYGLFWNSLSATQTKVENNCYMYHCGLGDLYINTELDKIYIEDAGSFRTVLAVNVANNTTFIASGIETSYISLNSKTKQIVERSTFSFDLGRYGIDIVLYDEIVYIPLQTFLDIFINNNGISFAYNGRNLYDVSGFGGTLTGDISDSTSLEYEFYTDSPWYHQTTREAKFAKYSYDEFCFSMDNFYGLKEHRGIASFNDYFVTNGYESDLKSTNSATYELGMARFVGAWMYEGHAGYTRVSPYQQNNSNISSTYYSYRRDYNPRYSLNTDVSELTDLRNNAGKSVGLTFSGTTAIISFDSFKKGKFWGTYTPDQYSYAVWHKNDTEMFFHKAFSEIETHSGITNVVIDITLNGGGMLDAIPWLEAYLSDDPFTLIRTKTTGEISEVHYTVDLNRNGTKGEAADTYKGRYNFFLMTSKYSFSCGNAFPTFVKAGNMATIIGETSGGGACAVSMMSTASGTVLRSSSIFQMGYFTGNDFILNEDGIAPDYTFSRNYFYNDAQINTFVNSL